MALASLGVAFCQPISFTLPSSSQAVWRRFYGTPQIQQASDTTESIPTSCCSAVHHFEDCEAPRETEAREMPKSGQGPGVAATRQAHAKRSLMPKRNFCKPTKTSLLAAIGAGV